MKTNILKEFYSNRDIQNNLSVKFLFNGDTVNPSLVFLANGKVYVVGGFFPIFSIALDDETFRIRFNKMNPFISIRYQAETIRTVFPDLEVEAVLMTNKKTKYFQFKDQVTVIKSRKEMLSFLKRDLSHEKDLKNLIDKFEGVSEDYAFDNIEIDSLETRRQKYYVEKFLRGVE